MKNLENALFQNFLSVNDFSELTLKALGHDFKKWVGWFEQINEEQYTAVRESPFEM